MPVLTETDSPRKRRRWKMLVGLYFPVVTLLLLPGAFLWSWFQPVVADLGDHGLGFGYGQPAIRAYIALPPRPIEERRPPVNFVELPKFTGNELYFYWWY